MFIGSGIENVSIVPTRIAFLLNGFRVSLTLTDFRLSKERPLDTGYLSFIVLKVNIAYSKSERRTQNSAICNGHFLE